MHIVGEYKNQQIVQSDTIFEMIFTNFPKHGRMINGQLYEVVETESTVPTTDSQYSTPTTMDSLPPKSAEALEREATEIRPGRTKPANLRDQVGNKTQWRTPTKAESHNQDYSNQVYLQNQVKQKETWPTPSKSDIRTDIRSPEERSDAANKGGCSNLRERVFYPTPNTCDAIPPKPLDSIIATNEKNRPGRSELSMNLREKVVYGDLDFNGEPIKDQQQWPTPNTQPERPNEGNVRILRKNVIDGVLSEEEAKAMLGGKSVFESQGKVKEQWPTPSATLRGAHTGKISGSVAENGMSRTSAKGTKFGATLQTAVAIKNQQQYPTPRACTAMAANITENTSSADRHINLETIVARKEPYPTPDASDRRGPNSKQQGLSNIIKGHKPTYGTPRAREGNNDGLEGESLQKRADKGFLDAQVKVTNQKMWATIQKRDYKDTGNTDKLKSQPGQQQSVVNQIADEMSSNMQGMGLNPSWVEWLMGYPKGWTDIDCDNPEPFEGWDVDPADEMVPQFIGTHTASSTIRSDKFAEGRLESPEEYAQNNPGTLVSKTPRLTSVKKNRANRIMALGNSIVSQAAAVILRIAKRYLEGDNTTDITDNHTFNQKQWHTPTRSDTHDSFDHHYPNGKERKTPVPNLSAEVKVGIPYNEQEKE